MVPYWELLWTKNRKFYWDNTLDQIFNESKQRIASEIEDGVRTSKVNRPMCLSTDFSRTRLGNFLFQKHCNCHWSGTNLWWRPLEANSSWIPINQWHWVMLCTCGGGGTGASIWIRVVLNIQCLELLVMVDHKPLIKIFSDKVLENIKKPWLFSLKECSLMYNFCIKHLPSKLNAAPDCTSKYPETPRCYN